MSCCKHRPEAVCLFTPCARRELVDGVVEVFTCLCASEVKAEQPENRVARVPDSAREGAA